jgi:hypothetical protein
MRKYQVQLTGSTGVRTMEFQENFMSDNFAVEYIARSLKYYYPTYYNAAVWRLDEQEEHHELLAEFSTTVTVTTKRKGE